MKRIIHYCIAVLFVNGSIVSLLAQTEIENMDYKEVVNGVEKREVIQQAMGLSEYEATVFWPIYEWYEHSRRRISIKYSSMMSEYVQQYDEMTDSEAHEFSKRLFECDQEFDLMYKDYYMRMRKAVGAVRALKFMQIEMCLQNVNSYESQTKIPFITQKEVDLLSKRESN